MEKNKFLPWSLQLKKEVPASPHTETTGQTTAQSEDRGFQTNGSMFNTYLHNLQGRFTSAQILLPASTALPLQGLQELAQQV